MDNEAYLETAMKIKGGCVLHFLSSPLSDKWLLNQQV